MTDGDRAVDAKSVRLTRDGGTPLVTLVFDELDTADQRRAASAARKVVKGLGENPFPVSVWQVDRSLQVLQSYTTDKGRVDAALRLIAEGNRPALADAAAAQERQLAEGLTQLGAVSQGKTEAVLLRTLAKAGEIAEGQHLKAGSLP